jgi:hypothetical protein
MGTRHNVLHYRFGMEFELLIEPFQDTIKDVRNALKRGPLRNRLNSSNYDQYFKMQLAEHIAADLREMGIPTQYISDSGTQNYMDWSIVLDPSIGDEDNKCKSLLYLSHALKVD